MPLFKYCRREHFESLQRSGTLRIGTLLEYQDIERYGSQIGDASEGWFPISGVRRLPPGGRMPGGAVAFEGGATVTMQGCCITLPAGQDRFLFCMSRVYNEGLHQRLRDDPKVRYDACYRITHEGAFVRGLSSAIADRARLIGLGVVQYRDGVVDFASPLAYASPELVKARDEYAHLQEVRAVYRPSGPPVEPFLIDVPGVRQLCELVATI